MTMRMLLCAFAVTVAVAPIAAAALQPAVKSDGKLIKVTGCVTGGPSKFTLTNAARSDEAAAKKNEPATAGVVTTYELTPRDGVSLAAHVGHRVELTGEPGEIKRDAEQPPPVGRRGLTAHLSVTSVRMISPICLE